MDTQPVALESAVRRSLAGLVDARDAGAVELAITYAAAIDDGADLSRVGPPLLACLAALGLTPAARAGLMKGGKDAGGNEPNPLTEIRAGLRIVG